MQFLKMIGSREIGGLDRTFNKLDFETHSAYFALRNLRCAVEDEYPVAVTTYDDIYPNYVPTMASKFATAPGHERLLALVNEDGQLHLLDTDKYGADSIVLKIDAHRNAAFDCCWMNSTPNHLVTVSGDTTAALWDVNTSKQLAEFRGHTSSIKTVDVRPEDQAVFATGSRDSNILVWDVRTNRRSDTHHMPINSIRHAHCLPRKSDVGSGRSKRPKKKNVAATYDPLQSVTTVVFQDDHTLISSGTADGAIKVWDLRKTYCNYKNEPLPKWVLPYAGSSVKRHGYSSAVMDSGRSRLFASCTDNTIYEYNCVSYDSRPINRYQGHSTSTFYVKLALCPEDNFLLSGSSDSNAYIWRVGHAGTPAYQLAGHYSEVTAVDFCRRRGGPTRLVTCADDMKTKIWRVNPKVPAERTVGMAEKLSSSSSPSAGCSFSPSSRTTSMLTTPVKLAAVASPLGPSPTVNLPNSVVDQPEDARSPYATPQRRRGKCNWLTKLASASSDSKRRKEEVTAPTTTTPTGSGKTPVQRRRLRNGASRNSLEKYFRPNRL